MLKFLKMIYPSFEFNNYILTNKNKIKFYDLIYPKFIKNLSNQYE